MTTPTLHGISINRFLVLNPPDSPPPVYDPHDVIINDSDGQQVRLEHLPESCRNCHSPDLFLDSCQGDRVCHQCGHVAEGHVMMKQILQNCNQPAIKDSSSVMGDDDGKKIPFTCNAELPDELIQESSSTTLSKHAFGKRSRSRRVARIRRQLQSTNQIMEQMVTQHSITNHDCKSEDHYHNEHDDRCDSPPILLQEDDKVDKTNLNQVQIPALDVDKWSLERAILLYGSPQEQNHEGIEKIPSLSTRKELLSTLDETLQRASLDLYTAYSMTVNAVETLRLPIRVTSEVSERLVRYAYRNDGFAVKGIRSKLSKKHHGIEREALLERLKEYNSLKQISAVSAATLFLSTRNLGWTRSMEAVCSCFRPQTEMNANETIFLKPKHITRAVAQVKCAFPDYARLLFGEDIFETGHGGTMSELNNNSASLPFSDKIIEKLQLPPVAEASIHFLCSHFRIQHRNGEEQPFDNVSVWTLCAAVTYFICSMGASMQTLAKEFHRTTSACFSHQNGKRPSGQENDASVRERKRPRQETPSETSTTKSNKDNYQGSSCAESAYIINHEEGELDASTVAKHICRNLSEKNGYEMRRMWDAWESQRSWSRSVAEIERCSGISREALLGAYQAELCPHRDALLCMLKDSSQVVGSRKDGNDTIHSLRSAPLSSILLADIPTVAPLMMAMAGQEEISTARRTHGLNKSQKISNPKIIGITL
jgi:transcription initiation factor TFIIIB Brf1 subunit/transcription initiation factor TFIIB